jgi:hypothetical protein
MAPSLRHPWLRYVRTAHMAPSLRHPWLRYVRTAHMAPSLRHPWLRYVRTVRTPWLTRGRPLWLAASVP